MRKYKFRGYNRIHKMWIYGNLIQFGGPESDYYIRTRDFKLEAEHPNHVDLLVVQESIGQFTGLNDVNGTEIYEGDLVIHPELERRPEEYLYVNTMYGCTYLGGWDCIRTDISKGTIVSNAYERLFMSKTKTNEPV